MPMGTRHRLVGLMLTSKRGPVLEVDDGGVWALDLDPSDKQFIGKRVTLEGTRSGFDRIDVDWIEPVGVNSTSSPA